MKLLLLNGHGINMHVDGAKLYIKDGRFSTTEEPQEYIFSPKRIDIDGIIIYGKSGNLTLEAIRWLIKHNVQVSILDWNGKLLTTMHPPEINFDVSDGLTKLKDVKSTREILGVEGTLAGKYWIEFSKAVPKEYDFCNRIDQFRRAMGSGDMVNTMLNYGYALLESECLRAINSVGLDTHVGFLHEMTPSKNSLAYDLQEPFRFLVDLAVISLVESGAMETKDFIRRKLQSQA
jgi:CRISPR-associated protein Cas1